MTTEERLDQLEAQVDYLSRFITTIQRIENVEGSGEGIGSILAPRWMGDDQIPLVYNLQTVSSTALYGGISFVISWTEPEDDAGQISHYIVYAKNVLDSNQQPARVWEGTGSPAHFFVISDNAANIALYVQTVLRNGMSSPILTSPTTSGSVVAPLISPVYMDLEHVFLDGFTWTNNSPAGGSVAWSSSTLYYKGAAYTITGGNTANKFIYWQLSSPTSFQTSASFPALGNDDFLIAVNNSGTHDLAWNNSYAASSFQKSHMAFAFADGFYNPQPLAGAAIDVSDGTGGTTDLINVSGQGSFLWAGINVTETIAANITVKVEWNIDGQGYQAITMYDNGVIFAQGPAAISVKTIGSGTNVGDCLLFGFNVSYNVSLVVRINVTQAAAGGPNGAIYAAAMRAAKLA